MAKKNEVTRSYVNVEIPEPLAQVVDKNTNKALQLSMAEINMEGQKALDAGVASVMSANHASMMIKMGKAAKKVIKEGRMLFTKPLDEWKKTLTDAEKSLAATVDVWLAPLTQISDAREMRLAQEERDRKRKAEEERLAAIAKAEAEEERRRNISLSKGGNGVVAPVEPKLPEPIVELVGMQKTATMKSIIDKPKIIAAINEPDGPRHIEGLEIFCTWDYKVIDAKKVPDAWRRFIRG